MNYKAADIANWFLAWTDDEPEALITHMKLQKLLYYAQGYYLGIHKTPLFLEQMEAWRLGPVVRDIWYDSLFKIKDEKAKKDTPLTLAVDFDFAKFDEEMNDFLISIWNTYGQYDGVYLSDLTHGEEPWVNNYYNDSLEDDGSNKTVIPTEDIMKYFEQAIENDSVYANSK